MEITQTQFYTWKKACSIQLSYFLPSLNISVEHQEGREQHFSNKRALFSATWRRASHLPGTEPRMPELPSTLQLLVGYFRWKLVRRFIKPIQLRVSLLNQSWPEMQLEFDIFPYLVHKFIMKNTAALSCSNIVLQKKNSSVRRNSLCLDNYKGQYGRAKSGKGNWVQTKKINTIKLNSIPWK